LLLYYSVCNVIEHNHDTIFKYNNTLIIIVSSTINTSRTYITMATTDKYDRQLRLWGAQGQRALSNTRVLSVGTSSAGTETLKNLVLPGVGAFTVMDFVDDDDDDNGRDSMTGIVTNQDSSTNFFLPKKESDNAVTKAVAACKYLQELNPDVSGSHRNLSLTTKKNNKTDDGTTTGPNISEYWKEIFEEELIRRDDTDTEMEESSSSHNNYKKKLLVIAADVSPPCILEALADACYDSDLPLIVVTSYGLIGSVRLQLPATGASLLQPKPTNSPPDLRLVSSFPSVRQLVDSINLDLLDDMQHGHIPYPVLLTKAIDRYHEDKSKEAPKDDTENNKNGGHGRILPKTFNEKQDFVNNYVKSMARDYNKQLNFQEAAANAYLAYTERDLNLDLTTVPMTNGSDGDGKTTKLGMLQSALEIFMEEHPDQRPPINGSVPDMTASTDLYVRLQRMYRDQGAEDVKKMTEIIRRQQQDTNNEKLVSEEDIVNFCSNVYSVGHIQTRSLRQEYHASNDGEDELVDDWKMALMDSYEVAVHTPILWYLGLRAVQIFCGQEGRYPGCVVACSDVDDGNTTLKKDEDLLTKIMKETVIPHYKLSDQELLLSNDDGDDDNNNVVRICKELTRYGNAEIHTIASVVGGVASQEAVKILTEQYVPLNNTYVYNGIVSVGGVYKF
jgi:amyloid beta precursor protein binding protein 1